MLSGPVSSMLLLAVRVRPSVWITPRVPYFFFIAGSLK